MSKEISDKYVKLSGVEHVLKRPDTYIGTIDIENKSVFVATNFEEELKNTKMVYKDVNYSPGFVKIFDEIITNASDHAIRTNKVSYIKVNISKDVISVENDGPGVPVVMHTKEKIYIPELIFGNLLSGQNFDDQEERFIGGRNGLGGKLTNIYSKEFIVETADTKKSYKQVFQNNMSKKTKPVIRKSKKSFTKVTYKPDFSRFSMENVDDDTMSVLVKRVFDIAAYNPTLKVSLNGKVIPIRTFKDYMKLFLKETADIFYEQINDKWEIGITESPIESFTQVSMVNGISTTLGGSHVNYATNMVVNSIKQSISRGTKVNIRLGDIKNRILIFVNCKLPNPTFNSQTKEDLTLRLNSLTKGVELTDIFLRKLSKADFFSDLLELSLMKERMEAEKALNKKPSSRMNIEKLFDANNAGKKGKSNNCHIFLTEGDSASTFAISGFKYIGRDNYGAYPLKGKPLNVRDAAMSKIKNNDEIKNIIQILGLEFGKKYKNTDDLRYGKLVVLSDSDSDGYHIAGLLINIIETFFPELLELDFLYQFITPIMRAKKGKITKYFYKLKEFEVWKETHDINSYKIKYFKGLGSIDRAMAKDLFGNLDKHLIKFSKDRKIDTNELVDMIFRKKRADDRKNWLSNYTLNTKFDKFAQKTTYESFFNNEFIEFSMEDNVRSIPSIVDGLKPSQRKILYTLNILNKGEMNVGEIFGFVKAKAEYHHGPASLEQGIIGMAQDFTGSNNISLLEPHGSFGSRLSGGKDSAAARYIYTELRDITKYIFLKEDSNILNYLEVDGKIVEPDFYLPIIPQVLLNGVEGIGTGWSSKIPNYKIEDLIEYIDNKISGKKKCIELVPYYEKFDGEVFYDEVNDNCVTRGIITKVNDSNVKITELPISQWNNNYYKFLEKLVDNKIIKNYQKNCTDEKVNINIKMFKEILAPLNEDDLFDMFELESTINMSNMHLFDVNGKIKKYETVYEIVNEFYDIRIRYYETRRQYIINKLTNRKLKLNNISNFIDCVINEIIKINNISIDKINKQLIKNDFEKIDDSYNYLLNIPLYKLSKDELNKSKEDIKNIKIQLKELSETTPEKMWHSDLIALKSSLRKYRK